MNWRKRIESDPLTMEGKLHVRGTGVRVSAVLDNLAERADVREVLACHPSLSEEDVRACIAYAAECVHKAEASEGAAADAPAAACEVPAEPRAEGDAHDFWLYLMSIPPGGEAADFERPLDYGRAEVEWD